MERAISFIKHNKKLRINELEKILGSNTIRLSILKLVRSGFSAPVIGKILDRERHVISNWLKRYSITPVYYKGFVPSILLLNHSEKAFNVSLWKYKKIDEDNYRVFYVNPTLNFSYVLGLILGDGHVDSRKIYISGGRTFEFLDSILPEVYMFAKQLGNRSVKVRYYASNDKEVFRDDPSVISWRVYIYWSALSHSLKK